MPEFSIIIPVFNVEAYINKCIDSVLAQTFSDYEIILVDDGSTDSSGLICDTYAEKYEKISVIHQENRGLGGARNTGIENAKGNYLFFLDSDDSVIPVFLEEIYSAINEQSAEIVVFDFDYVDENGNVTGSEYGWKSEKKLLNLKESAEMIFMPNSACNKVFCRSLFIDTGIRFREKEWFEDLSAVLKLYPYAEKVVYINKSYYLYLQRTGSIMKSKNLDRNKEIITAVSVVLDYYREKGLFECLREELEFLTILHVLIYAGARVVRQDAKHPLLNEFRRFVAESFPSYKSNKYLSRLSKKEKLIFNLIDKKAYGILYLVMTVYAKIR